MQRRADLPNRWLGEIVFLLWILALSLLLAFCYFASSLCITVLLASFLAILADPAIMFLERLRISRAVSAAVVIIAGTLIIGSLTYLSYRQVLEVVDDMPLYAERIGDAIAPVLRKVQRIEDSAGRIGSAVPMKKVPEVKIRSNYPDWTSYVVRGVGPVSGAAIMIGVVPFLMFFLLVQKKGLKEKLAIVWGDRIDVSHFATNVTDMIRGFVLGNLIIGFLMALVTVIVLLALNVNGAVILGIVSALLNLIPFLGAILGSLIPMGAALVQGLPMSTLLILPLTVIVLHTVSTNLLVPKIIGERVSISPVAATVGILFWGWLWGLMGVLLAVPLTALVKIFADSHPSLEKLSNLLAERPAKVPPWSRSSDVVQAPVERGNSTERKGANVGHYFGRLKDSDHKVS